MVNGVHDEKISGTVDRHTSWVTQLSGSRGSAVPAWTKSSISRHSGDRPRRGHLPNSLVTGVRDEEISDTVDRHSRWVIELSGSSGSAVPAKTTYYISRHSGDRARRGHLPNSLVTGVRDEKISGAVDRHISWVIQLSGSSWSAVPAQTAYSNSRHSGDRRRRGHLPNSLVTGIRDEEISGTVDHHTSWVHISRHSGDRARRGHLSNSIVTGVRDEEISGAVDCHISW